MFFVPSQLFLFVLQHNDESPLTHKANGECCKQKKWTHGVGVLLSRKSAWCIPAAFRLRLTIESDG